MTFKLKFPLDVGSNQTLVFQFTVVAKQGSSYIAFAQKIAVCTIDGEAPNELLITVLLDSDKKKKERT